MTASLNDSLTVENILSWIGKRLIGCFNILLNLNPIYPQKMLKDSAIGDLAMFLLVSQKEAKQTRIQFKKKEAKKADLLKTERAAWENLQEDITESSLKSFLNQYPNGAYSNQAKEKLEKLLSDKKKMEARIEEIDKLKNYIGGKWMFKCESISIPKYPNHHIINNGIIEVHQSGLNIQFKAQFYKGEIVFNGNYDDGSLFVSASTMFTNYEMTGKFDEDLKSISGHVKAVTFGSISHSAPFTMTLLKISTDPLKNSNVDLKGGSSAFCFISTLSE